VSCVKQNCSQLNFNFTRATNQQSYVLTTIVCTFSLAWRVYVHTHLTRASVRERLHKAVNRTVSKQLQLLQLL